VDEVRLVGTFNAELDGSRLARVLSEAVRVLKPGGKVLTYGLMADRPFPGAQPKLPGLAAMVSRVSVQSEPVEAFRRAGFGGLVYEKLGDIHCFSVNGVELRELRLQGRKPVPVRKPSRWCTRGRSSR
jgi:hypothetical protein